MGLKKNILGFRWAIGGTAYCGSPRPFLAILFSIALLVVPQCIYAQVSPSEILNPRLKALEKDYFSQLIAYNRAIQALKFPFPFQLRRYVGLSSKQDPAPDTRGLQFLVFHNQTILKISGNYMAAFNGHQLTRNQRAARVFEEVVVPILRILPQQIPATVACDGIGFEISYHVRSRDHSYDYEGAENLVVVIPRNDAFAFSRLSSEPDWQVILNRSQVYIDQQEYGLSLTDRDPVPLEALDKSSPDQSQPLSEAAPKTANPAAAPSPETHTPAPTTNAGAADDRLANLYRNLSREPRIPGLPQPHAESPAPLAAKASPPAGQLASQADAPPAATQSDVDRLQARYQTQLNDLAKDGATRMHFVAYAPPSFVIFQKRLYLQITLQNPHVFDAQMSSIYRRAAQSFDLFLALQLKPLIAQIPSDPDLAGLDITVLNELASNPKPSSEATEFICPLTPLRQFADAEITNQDLINQSVVLVNGVRVALNLQQVE
jgi:hypothetical protein